MNPIAKLQKWMDTPSGQVFMNYAYSWGAAVVILGTLFKLTHIPGANAMLFIGMGTEVFVFFISAFEKTYEKVPRTDNQQQAAPGSQTIVVTGVGAANAGNGALQGTPFVPQSGAAPQADATDRASGFASQPTLVVGRSAGSTTGNIAVESGVMAGAVAVESGAIKDAAGLSAAAANLAAAGQAAAQAQLALGQLQNNSAGVDPSLIRATDSAAVADAVENYAKELTELTEVLGRVKNQAARMSTDSEEMENLNRTLTGIATVYELQLRNISKQVSTIEQIDEQTRRMAQQIEELNNVYGRMIKALTVNMGGAPSSTTFQGE